MQPPVVIPPGWRARFAWSELAPRLIDPTMLAILEAFVRLERPHHFKVLTRFDVLEVVDVQLPDEGGEEPFFDFPPPPREPSPSSSGAGRSPRSS